MLIKLVALGLLVAVLISLFSGLYALMKGEGSPQERTRLARALTWRVVISILLFVFLLIARRLG